MKKGLFIALEGLDGSGKSTQGNIIKEYLLNKDTDQDELKKRLIHSISIKES